MMILKFYTTFLIAKLARLATLNSLSSALSDFSTLTAFFLICTKIRHSYTHPHKRIHTLNILNARPGGLAINNRKSHA